MTAPNESAAGWTPAAQEPASRPANKSRSFTPTAQGAASPVSAPPSLSEAMNAASLAVRLQTPLRTVTASGIVAKAALAFVAVGDHGLCQSEAMGWTAQLGSAVRDLRALGIEVTTVRGNPRRQIPTRYALPGQPQIFIVAYSARGGAR